MTQSADVQDVSNGVILVADDDHITQLFIQKILQKAGYDADFVANGKEAISALESRHYDLVVMDCNMPLMDGFAATRHIRNTTSKRINSRIPVIALTGLTSKADQSRCLEAGMNSFINKPVDSLAFIVAIEQCLGNSVVKKPASQDELEREQIPEDGFLDTLISGFLEEVPQVVAELQRAVKQGDVVELESIGHRLSGATGILEASTLSAHSKALEHAGKAGDLTLASKLASKLIEELNKLMTALKE